MGYIGKVPADVLIDPHVDSAAITDGTIITADIANDAVTSAKLAQNSVDSSELIDGSVDNSHLAGSIAMNKTLLSAGTGLTLSTNTLSVDAAQSQITSVGTLTSLTTSGSAGSAYVGSFTNASATGWGLFVKGGADNADYSLRVQDKDADDLLAVKSGGRIGINTNDPASQLHIFSDASGVDTILEVECNATNASAMLHLDSAADRDSGVYFQENGTYKGGIFNDASEDATIIMDGSNNNTISLVGNNATFAGAASFVGMVTSSISGTGFRTIHASTTTKYTSLAYDGLYTAGAQHQYIQSAQDIKFYPGGTNEVTFADGGLATFAGSITSGTHLIQGVSNYTGLEVKGSGGSRPQVKFTNVNNGTLGSIYGTESNGLEITSGTNGYSAISLSSAQEVSLAAAVKFQANSGATRAKLHWYNASTTLSHQYYHLKTDISYGDATQMYSVHFLGHAYNDSKAIDTILTFYNYDNGSVLAIGSTGNHSATVYESSDGKVVMALNLGAGNTYYSGFTLSQYHTRQGVADFNVSAITTSNSGSGEY